MDMRLCVVCREMKPETREFFGMSNGVFRRQCRICKNRKNREYSALNPDLARDRAQRRKWRATEFTSAEREEIVDKLWKKQAGICLGCESAMSRQEVEIDHKTPVSRGGSNNIRNLCLMHRCCNREKYDRTLKEYKRWRLVIGGR